MLERCWTSQPNDRPSIEDVLQYLEYQENQLLSPNRHHSPPSLHPLQENLALINWRPSPKGMGKAEGSTATSSYLNRLENAAQTANLHVASEGNDGKDGPQAHQPISRGLVPQEIYKTTRQWSQLSGSGVVEFVVDGKEGIRLSDALEGHWRGFEGRDDRSFFGDDRYQIMIRLHVRCSVGVHNRLLTNFAF
jgi:hypothetical protein